MGGERTPCARGDLAHGNGVGVEDAVRAEALKASARDREVCYERVMKGAAPWSCP